MQSITAHHLTHHHDSLPFRQSSRTLIIQSINAMLRNLQDDRSTLVTNNPAPKALRVRHCRRILSL